MMMFNIFDILIAVVSVIIFIVAISRGFVLSIVRVIRPVVAIPLACFTAKRFSQPIYDGFIRERICSILQKKIDSMPSPAEYVSSIMEGSEKSSLFKTQINEYLSRYTDVNSAQLTEYITDNFVESIAVSALKILLFALTMLIVYLLFCAIISIVQKTKKKHKALNGTDRFFGGVFGLVKALVVVVGICTLAQLVISVVGDTALVNESISNSKFFAELSQSKVISFVNTYNPLVKYLEV